MSFYNMIFGMNAQTDLLLAVLGLRQVDVERLRNVFASEDGKTIEVYTRTGGGNREDYPNLTMRKLPTWTGSVDDDYDSTYCTDTFNVPAEFVADVAGLSDPLTHGLRAEFGQHLSKTLRREPTEADKNQRAYDAEKAALARTLHFMANGHTFVPQDDLALITALDLAEANDGSLRSCWGIAPLAIEVKRNFHPYPSAREQKDRDHFVRVQVDYDFKWTMDTDYWAHMQKRFGSSHPKTMAKIADSIESYLARAA